MYDKIIDFWVEQKNSETGLGRRVEIDVVVTVEISVCLPEDEAYISLIRQIGRALLEHHAVPDQDIDDVETLVGELCSNVTRHARSQIGSYRVAIEQQGGLVAITVTDYGQGFDPAQVPPVGTERQEPCGTFRHGGYGLKLVDALADHVEFQTSQPQGTTVRAIKKLQDGDSWKSSLTR
jgi:anti-sigma regulatory factor (Ser/Thr protein kinase)